ncbi:MAG: hypothetical protein PUP93_13320 [Rhizonema sp. NSF051]|nr:hypothetical protein [Rhizonema sp. NSF051]
MKRKIVAVGASILLIYSNFDTRAQAIAAPQCKDIPSCGVAGIVIGTEIIAGVLYYIVKNAAGAVHRIRSRHQIPIHNNANSDHEEIFDGLVSSEEECKRKALIQGERFGGLWTHRVEDAGITSPDAEPMRGRRQLKCYIRRVE